MNPEGTVFLFYILWENSLLALDLLKGRGSAPIHHKCNVSPTAASGLFKKWYNHTKFYFKVEDSCRNETNFQVIF